jgi:AcrR family transcriptional regulator
MNTKRLDIRSFRREQIVEAAAAVIAEQGLQNLSLSEIEKKAGMSRGQLTYYFPAKEEILLAVFDRLLQQMYEQIGATEGTEGPGSGSWELVRGFLERLIGQPPLSPEFHLLEYTFLSQIGHRDDFRRRLATLYEEWRSRMADGIAADLAKQPSGASITPRALATVILALLQGLGVQAAADPNAFPRDEVVNLCLDMLGRYLRAKPAPARNGSRK